MSRTSLSVLGLATLVLAGCGGGGLNYYLYPEPHLPESEEALFVAYESHLLQAIDGEDTAMMCWGGSRQPQAYGRRDVVCRLHIQPGEHTVVFLPGVGSLERANLTFTAVPGKTYGLDRSACTATFASGRESCRVEIKEIQNSSGIG